MAAPTLSTKFFVPPHTPTVVSRKRLIELLDRGTTPGTRLTLISAPAGFGKTTLVSEWIATSGRTVAWLSLDENDNDPVRFLIYIIEALRQVNPDIGAEALVALQSPQPPPSESVLTSLLNEVSALRTGLLLVLDDLHEIDSQWVDRTLSFLIEHMPPRMHLVVTTREDPALPLHRLRARNQMVELRAADLRFTPSEAAQFLNQKMDLSLSPENVAALEDRTEGWIAGLQLAALSLQGRENASAFIRDFEGDHRYIADYLVEEVLRHQPGTVRNFLLRTSILERLTGPLCDAVTGQKNGKERLETLRRGNFFLIPLDDRGRWYRYHHLFGEVLRIYLISEQPDQIPGAHRRASEWLEQNGYSSDAIRHALAAADFERAADLIELALPEMRQTRQEAALLAWFQALPEAVLEDRPALSVHYAGVLLQNGRLDGVEPRLQAAERWLDSRPGGGEKPAPSKQEELRRVPGWIATYRAAISLVEGDLGATFNYAQRALELIPEDDHLGRGAPAGLLGLLYWRRGDLEAAYRYYDECLAQLLLAGHIPDAIGASLALGDIRIAQGRLRKAMRIYQRGLQLSAGPGALVRRGAADMHVGIADLLREQNDLDGARRHLAQSEALGEYTGLPQNPYRRRVAEARMKLVDGDPDGALVLLDEAESRYEGDFFPNIQPIPALKARIWIEQGDLGKALGWAREQGLTTGDTLSYLREFEHITLARLLLARARTDQDAGARQEALSLLARLLAAAEAGGMTGSVLEILVLTAIAHRMQADIPAALDCLARVLAFAEPEGYVRLFVDAGAPMSELLREALTRGITPTYSRILLAAFDDGRVQPEDHTAAPATQALIEPLSPRELEILRLLNTDLSGPEIARELVVALSTIRTHTKSIYGKLDVTSRRAAVRRAQDLGLI